MEIPTQPKENMEPKESPRHHYAYCCQHGYKQFVLYCPQCKESFCKDCIGESGTGLFCTDCGSSLIPTNQLPPLRQKSIAVFLALVFGVIGLHHFYVGRTGAGVTHLFLSIVSAMFIATPYVIISFCWLVIASIVSIAQAAGYRNDVDAWHRPLI